MNTMKKSTINSLFSIITISITVICVILSIIITANNYSLADNSTNPSGDTPDMALKSFLASMSMGRETGISSDNTEVIRKIENAFGKNTWNNVKYSESTGLPPITKEVYIDVESNNSISKQTYDKMLLSNIEKICSENSFNSQFLSYTGEDLLKLTPEQTVKRNIILQELRTSCPVKIDSESAVPYQYFSLTFNDRDRSDDAGICNFRVVFIKENEEWKFRFIQYDAIDIIQEDI